MQIQRTDKTTVGALVSVLLTFLVVMLVSSAAAVLLGAPATPVVFWLVVITALAGSAISIEVTY